MACCGPVHFFRWSRRNRRKFIFESASEESICCHSRCRGCSLPSGVRRWYHAWVDSRILTARHCVAENVVYARRRAELLFLSRCTHAKRIRSWSRLCGEYGPCWCSLAVGRYWNATEEHFEAPEFVSTNRDVRLTRVATHGCTPRLGI